ncbi:MAG: tetratricopeptide repeat protein [Desulfitobacteriaceae bacterium]
MRKRTQRIAAIIIAVLVSFSMIGSAVFGYIYTSFSNSPSPTSQSASAEAQFKLQKSKVEGLEQSAKEKPDDSAIQEELANAYYDLAIAAQQSAPNEAEAVPDFAKAVQGYQAVLKNKKDINVLVDMATAAFYAGQDDVAEKGFQEALAEKGDFFNALSNYGIFLIQAKNDYAGALSLWQGALAKDPSGPNASKLKELIAQAESRKKT